MEEVQLKFIGFYLQNLHLIKVLKMQRVQKKKKPEQQINIKKDFKEFFIAQIGSSTIKQTQFQSVSPSQSSSSSNDFKDQDDEVQQKGIKTFQFWNGLKIPKDAPKPTELPVQWEVSCPFSFGFNSLGKDNIIYIDGLICKAVGCVLIFNKQIYSKHSKKITTLAFNSESSELLSATESPGPEFFLWHYHSQSNTLEFMRRFSIGSKSEDIYSISFFQEDFVVCVELFTLHKSSTMNCFTKIDGKKVSSFKAGKFYDLELINSQKKEDSDIQGQEQEEIRKERLFFANDEGIFQLISQSQEKDKPIFRTQKINDSDNVCCLLPFYDGKDLEIIYGDKHGNINLVFSKESLRIHEGWIFQLKYHKHKNKNYFFALGAMDLKLSVIQYSNKKIQLIRKLQLGGYGRSIQTENDSLLIGKRDGDYEEFSLTQLIQEKYDSKITRRQTLSLKCFESKEIKKEHFFQIQSNSMNPQKQSMNNNNMEYPTKSYIYGQSKSKTITFFTISNRNMTNFQPYALRYYPQSLEIKSNFLAYIYFVEREENEQTSVQFSKTSKFRQKTVKKLILVIEDIQTKNALAKIPIETDTQKKPNDISVIVKFSPSGKFLAVSDPSGNLFMVIKNEKGLFSQQLIKCDKKMHKQVIRQITWSKDQRFLKTISETELHYWEVSGKDQNDIKLLTVKAGQIMEVIWSAISKFGWQTKNVWESTDLVGDIYKFWSQQHTRIDVVEKKSTKQVSAERQTMIGCIRRDGYLRIYNYPAKGSNRQQIRISNEAFEVCPYWASNDKFSFLVLIEGIVALIELNR